MNEDKDIKIAGDRPSVTIRSFKPVTETDDDFERQLANGNIAKARALGERVADKFCEAGDDIVPESETAKNADMLMQRQQLLAFAVRIGLERFCPNATVADSATGSFEKSLQKNAPAVYASITDTGAFSFYFLAYRRGGDVERRMGQTFAMLCSHDGDPIYQELGEALYCWFISYIQTQCEQAGFAAD